MFKCECCGKMVEKITPFKSGECPQNIQHEFREVKGEMYGQERGVSERS